MKPKNLVSTMCALFFTAAILKVAVQAGVQSGEKVRCPCDDPTPDRTKFGPAQFLGEYGLHVCAFHIGKDDPTLQVESHHYCTPLRDGVFQCVIYDGDKGNPKLIGVEYILSDEIFQTLPAEEKKYWHPHEYEIRAGLLTFPGVKPDCEMKLLKGLVKSWGKVWHTWPDPKTALPIGPPVLMWSATREGQVKNELIRARDHRYKIDVNDVRKQREKL
jgi:hypothetical protein